MLFFFDTETTGTPRNYNAPVSNSRNWPRLVQLAWAAYDDAGAQQYAHEAIINPKGFTIPADAVRIHGITTERARREGEPLHKVLTEFLDASKDTQLTFVGHNIAFDMNIVAAELFRLDYPMEAIDTAVISRPSVCTMRASTEFCRLPGPYGYKWPKLPELYWKLFSESYDAHHALADVTATARCFFALRTRGVILD